MQERLRAARRVADANMCTDLACAFEKNEALQSGFSRSAVAARGRLEEAIERLKQRSGPVRPDDGPFPGCPARLPRAMKETGRSATSRPREPSPLYPRGAEGSQGHVNSGPLALSATPSRPAREARITEPFRAPRQIQTPAAAAAVTRTSVRAPPQPRKGPGQPQPASHLIRDATPRLRWPAGREPGRGHPAAARLDHF